MNDGLAGLDEDYGLDPMSFVTGGLGKRSVDLYIGDKIAAGDIDLLRAHDITSVLNTAVNLDINYVGEPIIPRPPRSTLMSDPSPFRSPPVRPKA